MRAERMVKQREHEVLDHFAVNESPHRLRRRQTSEARDSGNPHLIFFTLRQAGE
jgi:hypothetical protein